jgi:hypothetical protein
MNLLRDLWAFLRDLPDLIAGRADSAVMDAHGAEPVPTDDIAEWPGGVMPWCVRCNLPWPCDVFVEASDRMDARPS